MASSSGDVEAKGAASSGTAFQTKGTQRLHMTDYHKLELNNMTDYLLNTAAEVSLAFVSSYESCLKLNRRKDCASVRSSMQEKCLY